MNTDPARGLILAAGALLLAGCEQSIHEIGGPASTFGEANRQTYASQVIDPEPEYERLNPETSGQKAAAAIDRYRTDRVKQPQSIRTTSGAGN